MIPPREADGLQKAGGQSSYQGIVSYHRCVPSPTQQQPLHHDKVFRSECDGASTLTLLILPLLMLIAVFASWSGRPIPIPVRWLSLVALLLGLGLPFWVFFGTDYTLRDSELAIRSGPFHWRIPIASIHSVSPSRSLRSSPALSMNRLAIHFGADHTILISPENQQEFCRELERRRARS